MSSSTGARTFEITVLGRTLEHLGTQMYKRRDVAIAELVANAWDAGATEVRIDIPLAFEYSPSTSVVSVSDNGVGMDADQVDDEYLVIGRNRRTEGQVVPKNRKPMGRKGVGKLAGFGLGKTMAVTTWRGGLTTQLELDGAALKADGGQSKVLEIEGSVLPSDPTIASSSGTRVSMRNLKHKTPPKIDELHQSIGRRFSRSVRGSMQILINDEPLRELDLDLVSREPDADVELVSLSLNQDVTWWAGFSRTVLPRELQGFTILVNGKTAQAPPYFFGVEGTASGQHGTKYLTGVIEADYLDDGQDDESDRISTDRQEIDWDDDMADTLKAWGESLTRRLLRERSAQGEAVAEKIVKEDADLERRLSFLDAASRNQATKFIRALGSADTSQDKLVPLSDTIIRAFEYRQFHDYVGELEEAATDPKRLEVALSYIQGWKVLESRAILEVIKGRIEIVDKFFSMIVNNATETARPVGSDNLHDLIASYPWLLNPDWQVLSEEKTLSKQLTEWGYEGGEDDISRYDFLALDGDGQTIVIEIKRSNHPVSLDDLQQLERYIGKLGQGRSNIHGVCITGQGYDLGEAMLRVWQAREDIDLLMWSDVHKRTADHYHHYKAILNSELAADSFSRKQNEVALTRSVLGSTSYRSPADRRRGLGPQDTGQ